ncbi:MAG: Ku protein [Archangium sp.]|nr:Ku protein [Archangium sp.]MDP3157924.1 Ku protein [Archangium sp.]MDP3571834.1 Ku protein [Archangium sp.]
MAARAMGTGTISFGLVNIPVKVFSANNTTEKISFNQLHADKKTRLKQQMYDPETGEIVPREKIVKGYEYAKDQYLIVNEEELDALELATSRSMDITEFVPLDSVDPLYFENGYYLGPDKGAERAYKLLAAALTDARYAAVAKYVARGKQQLVVFRPLNGSIVMQQLRYAEEVKTLGEIPIPDATVTEAELGLAKQFITAMAKPKFDITQYKDEYRERLRDMLDRKIKGEAVDLTPQPAPVAKVVDLMEALKASLARGAAAPAAAPVETERKPPKRAAASDEAAEPAKKKKAKG